MATEINGLTVSSTTATFTQPIFLPTVGGTPTALNYYENISSSFAFGGIWPVPNNTIIDITRIGNLVVLNVYPGIIAAAIFGVVIVTLVAIPVRMRPVATISAALSITDNGVLSIGQVVLSSAGILTISHGDGSAFSGVPASGSGFSSFSISYLIS